MTNTQTQTAIETAAKLLQAHPALRPLGCNDTMPRMDVTGKAIVGAGVCQHPVARLLKDWYGIKFMGRDADTAFLCAECGRRLTIAKQFTGELDTLNRTAA